MQDSPLVSIIIPTYNRAHLIGETIQSVIDQTYTHWELIIVDDGSEDNTREEVGMFSDTRIQYHALQRSGFVGAVRNYGIDKAKGTYIAFFDSDDLWRKDKLDFQLQLFQRHPESKFIISNGETFGSSNISTPDYESIFVGSLFWPILEEKRFVLYTPSLIVRREVFDRIGLLKEDLGGADMEFFLRLSSGYVGIFTNERLVKIRKHDKNTSDGSGINRYLSIIKTVNDFYKKGALQKEQHLKLISLYYYKMGLLHFTLSQPRSALRAFWNHVKLVPLHWKGWIRLLQAGVLSIKS